MNPKMGSRVLVFVPCEPAAFCIYNTTLALGAYNDSKVNDTEVSFTEDNYTGQLN